MRIIRKIIKLIAFLCLIVFVACIGSGVVFINNTLSEMPDITTIDFSPKGFATYIYDNNGKQTQKLIAPNANRTAVSINDIPESMQQAIVAIEDERFYSHNGIDIRGILRALWKGIASGFHFHEGASTITQQLLKNNVFQDWTEEKTLSERLSRKIQEQYLALQLEKMLKDKNLIMENYLNTINFGSGTYGVQAASKKYFNKNIQDLTLSETTVLAAIPQNPTKYNPATHPDNNEIRRKIVLRKMVEQGYISEKEWENALNDNVYDRIKSAQEKEEKQTVYSFFVDALTEQVVTDLQKQKGYSEEESYRLLYSGGLQIFTTQDEEIQKICDEEFQNPENFPDEISYELEWALSILHPNGEQEHFSREMLRDHFKKRIPDFSLLFETPEEGMKYVDEYKKLVIGTEDKIVAERCFFSPEPQASLVVMGKDGQVKALLGGRGEKTASLTLDRATQVKRQPGSTFKILSAYAEALEEGYTIAKQYKDEEYFYKNGTPVRNMDGKHHGLMSIKKAIATSNNVVAVKALEDVTTQKGYERLLQFGISSLNRTYDMQQALVLGGLYEGVTNLELTAAYAALANEGTYIRPVFYTKILDRNGELLILNTQEKHQAVSKETAWILTDAMKGVMKETGKEVVLNNNMPVAGKTGTTSNNRDFWFVGYTPYYTMGLWSGYDNYGEMDDSDFHKILWGKIMGRLTKDLKVIDFQQPSTVKKGKICQKSGKPASEFCRKTMTDYISIGEATCNECGVRIRKKEETKPTDATTSSTDEEAEIETEIEAETDEAEPDPEQELDAANTIILE